MKIERFDLDTVKQLIMADLHHYSGEFPEQEMIENLSKLARSVFEMEHAAAEEVISSAIELLVQSAALSRVKENSEVLLKDLEFEKRVIEGLARSLREAIQYDENLPDVDLVIEAGVGTDNKLYQAIQLVYPNALYVGTDLVFNEDSRVRGRANDEHVAALLAGKTDEQNRTICANAFDHELVQDLLARTGRKKALLVSSNALYALMNDKNNHTDRKDNSDRFKADRAFSQSPYAAHLHLTQRDIWNVREDHGAQGATYSDLLLDAQIHGWEAHQLKNGLLLKNLAPLEHEEE